MSYFNLVQGNSLPVVRALLEDASGYLNLSSSSVYFVYRGKYTTGVAPVTGAAEIIDAAGGSVEYSWNNVDTSNPGVYYCYWMVSGTNGKIEHFPNNTYIKYLINPLL